MGVDGGSSFIRACASKPSPDKPVQQSFRDVGQALSSLDGDLCIVIDANSYFYGIFLNECKHHSCYGPALKVCRQHWPNKTWHQSKAEAQEAILEKWLRTIAKKARRMLESCPQGTKVRVVFDNAVAVEAKAATRASRRQTRRRMQDQHSTAMRKLEALTRWFSRGDSTKFPCGRIHMPEPLRKGRFSRHAGPLIEQVKRTSTAIFSPTAVASFFSGKGKELLADVDWLHESLDAPLPAPQEDICFILAANEADITILNWCRGSATSSITNVVLASDTDYNFVPPASEVPFTLSYRRFGNRRNGIAAAKPHVLTYNKHLHTHPHWVWVRDEVRHVVTLAAGHDYLPKGLKGAGLFSLSKLSSLKDARDLNGFLNVLRATGGKWLAVSRDVSDNPPKRATMEKALLVFDTYRHTLVQPHMGPTAPDAPANIEIEWTETPSTTSSDVELRAPYSHKLGTCRHATATNGTCSYKRPSKATPEEQKLADNNASRKPMRESRGSSPFSYSFDRREAKRKDVRPLAFPWDDDIDTNFDSGYNPRGKGQPPPRQSPPSDDEDKARSSTKHRSKRRRKTKVAVDDEREEESPHEDSDLSEQEDEANVLDDTPSDEDSADSDEESDDEDSDAPTAGGGKKTLTSIYATRAYPRLLRPCLRRFTKPEEKVPTKGGKGKVASKGGNPHEDEIGDPSQDGSDHLERVFHEYLRLVVITMDHIHRPIVKLLNSFWSIIALSERTNLATYWLSKKQGIRMLFREAFQVVKHMPGRGWSGLIGRDQATTLADAMLQRTTAPMRFRLPEVPVQYREDLIVRIMKLPPAMVEVIKARAGTADIVLLECACLLYQSQQITRITGAFPQQIIDTIAATYQTALKTSLHTRNVHKALRSHIDSLRPASFSDRTADWNGIVDRTYDLFARCRAPSLDWGSSEGRSILGELAASERELFVSEINTMLAHGQASFPHHGSSLTDVLGGRIADAKKWDLLQFFHVYGLNLNIDLSPSFYDFDLEVISVMFQGKSFAQKCLAEVQSQHDAIPQSILETFTRSSRVRSLAHLMNLGCFERPDQWLKELDIFCNAVKASTGCRSKETFRAHRLQLFDELFKPGSIPDDVIWSGSFLFDGHTTIFRAIDPSQARVGQTLQSNLGRKDATDYTAGELFERLATGGVAGVAKFIDIKAAKARAEGQKKSETIPTADWSRLHAKMMANPSSLNRIQAQKVWNTRVSLLPDPRTERTRAGLPRWVPTLNSHSAKDIRTDLGLGEKVVPGDNCRIIGVDTGQVFPIVAATNSDPDGASRSLAFSARARQEITRTAQQKKARLFRNFPIALAKAASMSSNNAYIQRLHELGGIVHHRSIPYLESSWRRRQQVTSLQDRLFGQLLEIIGTDRKDPTPTLFVIGDGWGPGSGYTRKTPDFANSIVRYIIRTCRAQDRNVHFMRVQEGYSSISCPDPQCLRDPRRDWKGRTHGPPSADWIRSRLGKARYAASGNEVQRVLQCENCQRVFHRDVVGSHNVAFIAWHVLQWGEHPWVIERATRQSDV